MQRRRELMAMQKSAIVFQPTEYLTASRNYLPTGIIPQTGLEMECNIKRGTWTNGSVLSGTRLSGQAQERLVLFGFNGTMAIGADAGWISDGGCFGSNVLVNIKSGILSNKQYLIVEGVSKIDQSAASNIYYENANLPLGGVNYAGDVTNVTAIPNVTYYPHVKYWLNGALVRDYIPGYRKSDNAGGMLDLQGSICSDTGTPFYPFQGTGTITLGADVQ